MHVYISADHGGFVLKNQIITKLHANHNQSEYIGGLQITDLGPAHLDPDDDYPHFAFRLAEQVAAAGGEEKSVFGILICRSGIGMSIAANKVDGAYAGLCHTLALAVKAREHNDANILILDADYEHTDDPLEIVQTFLTTKFAGGRHERRVEQIKQYELHKSGEWLA